MSHPEFPAELPPIPDNPYIFLGGTCGGSDWRDDFTRAMHYNIAESDTKIMKSALTLDPRVSDWTQGVVNAEGEAKDKATGLVFYLGDPEDPSSRASMYSGAEAMLYSLTRPLDTAVILDITSPWSTRHDDRQRMNLAKLIYDNSPETTIAWSTNDATRWAACKLLGLPYVQKVPAGTEKYTPWFDVTA